MEAASSSDDAFRIALEEIYEDGGLTKACFKLEDESDDMRKLTEDEHGGKGAHVYGDTDADLLLHLFANMLERPISCELDSFCDLGSGSGKLLLQMCTRTASVIGIELSATRHEAAESALWEAQRRGHLSSRGNVHLYCASMLRHVAVAESNLIYCYSLALSPSFLSELRADLEARLPIGALVLLRGQGFPNDGVVPPTTAHRLQPVVETRIVNRVHNYFGYRLVESDPVAAAAAVDDGVVRTIELELQALPLGSTRFERLVFVQPEAEDESAAMQELFEGREL